MSRLYQAIRNPFLVYKALKSMIHKYREHAWAKKDSKKIRSDENVLFVDLGANLGQGYLWFKRYFDQSNISFELFEPNPFCYQELNKLPDVISGKSNCL